MAAGKGTRMKSDLPKVLLPVNGRPMLDYVLETARSLNPARIVVVVGHMREKVIESFAAPDVTFAMQEPQLGTAHAVAQSKEALSGFFGEVVTLSGDVPLLSEETLRSLIAARRKDNAAVAMLTCVLDNPGSYGRIIRENGEIVANVEAKDASPEQLKIREINSGVYVFESGFLFRSLGLVGSDNAQGEYYLTDLINMASKEGLPVAGVVADDITEALGANTVDDLKHLSDLAAAR